MGENVVRVSKEICGPKGLFGAFCIETIITPDTQFYIMEISARIVAGTNLFIDGSPYSYFNYSEPMSTGRRIAREIKNALLSNSLGVVLDEFEHPLDSPRSCLRSGRWGTLPAGAAIQTDPLVLYGNMKRAFDRGAQHGWSYVDQIYYLGAIFDAGRAYSLLRPADPNYMQVARIAVDVATLLHYDPITNSDASVWYMREAATTVLKNAPRAPTRRARS